MAKRQTDAVRAPYGQAVLYGIASMLDLGATMVGNMGRFLSGAPFEADRRALGLDGRRVHARFRAETGISFRRSGHPWYVRVPKR